MSVLVVYWLMLRPLARALRGASTMTCLVLLVLLWAIPSSIQGILIGFRQEIFGCEEWGFTFEFLWCFLKNGPVGNVHIFASGSVAARLFILTCTRDATTGEVPNASTQRLRLAVETAPYVFRFGVILGYALYVVLILFCNPKSPSPPDWEDHSLWGLPIPYWTVSFFYHQGCVLCSHLLSSNAPS